MSDYRTQALALLREPNVIICGLVLSAVILVAVGRRVHRFARSKRPDDALSSVAMLIGLGWSSEAIWELTGRIENFPGHLRFLLFFVLEALLTLSMIRARRSMRDRQHPGRSGRTAWIIAAAMAAIAGSVAHSLPEALLRMAIPLLVTKQWWDGLVGEGVRKAAGATSWRWTPRRLLLWLGAIEPGERDVETVNRERVTQQMTRLEYRRRHGLRGLAGRRSARLARLSLTADDDMIAEVQRRVGRATWFEATQPAKPADSSPREIPAAVASSARVSRIRHRRSLRTVRVTHPRPVIVAAQTPPPDLRETSEKDLVVRVIKEALPTMPNVRIARLACVSEPTVRRALRRTRPAEPTQKVNGNVPHLVHAEEA